MSKIRNIQALGFPWKTQDPFLFCAYHLDRYPAGNDKMGPVAGLQGRPLGQDFTVRDGWRMYHGSEVPGFPYHPHRGFETITINKQGFVDHTDSLGAAGRFGAGDVQWMTAGKGVQHSEMFPLVHPDGDNTLEIFQVWLNLPRAGKMVDPHFKMLWREDIPKLEYGPDGAQVEVDLIAGQLDGEHALTPPPASWAVDPDHGVEVLTVRMDPSASWTLHKSVPGVNTSIFFYRGSSLKIEGQQVQSGSVIETSPDEALSITNGSEEAYLLILRGRPIGEPVVQYGPFVMNSQEEIMQTFEDFRRTEFGGWPWPEKEQTHPRDAGRFALHADGTKESK